MAEKQDYYEILGVSRGASESDIKSAYRKLCKEYHPDVASNKAQAEKKFKEINEAYEVLSSPEKRSVYDRFGHAGLKGAGFGEGDFGFGGFGGSIFEDVFDAFFGRAAQGGAGRRGHTRPTRGSDLEMDLEISLEEAFSGLEREIEIPVLVACDRCKGNGAKPGTHTETCSACNGTGEVWHVQNTFLGQIIQ
ncbi:MAG: J domain-containing protein, partial [Armatimonadetes bacterium]|nr:J domain-containing protein [Armatimonadota bacterium]